MKWIAFNFDEALGNDVEFKEKLIYRHTEEKIIHGEGITPEEAITNLRRKIGYIEDEVHVFPIDK